MKETTVKEAGRLGGITRAKKLSKEERRIIAVKGGLAQARKFASMTPEERREYAQRANKASHEAKRRKKRELL